MFRHWHSLTLAVVLTGCLDPNEPGNLVAKTVDEDPSLPAVEINKTRLHAEVFGDPQGPMIMVLHGGPGADYRSLLPMRALADDGYRVVFWDHRGSGLSRRHSQASYTLNGYLEDLRLVIEHFSSSDAQPIVFLGQSWGAMYATWFINEHGDYGGRVSGAILNEPGAFTLDGLRDYTASFYPPWGFTSEALNDLLWSEQVISPFEHAQADYASMIAGFPGYPREHNDPKHPNPLWRFGAVANAALSDLAERHKIDWTTHLGEFTHPVLFLRGELNENMPLRHQQKLASYYADAKIITVRGVGHEGIWERPDEFLRHIRAYLTEVMP